MQEQRRAVAVAGHTGDIGTARAGLDDADPAVRSTALGALDRLDALVPEDLARAATDPDRGVRRRAAELLAAHPGGLGALLADPDPDVVAAACWAAGERAAAAADLVDHLAAVAAGHEDPICRENAVAALGAIGDRRGLAAILAATGDRPAVRRRAVLALAPFEGADVDAALARARQDRDWQVRQAAEDLTAADG